MRWLVGSVDCRAVSLRQMTLGDGLIRPCYYERPPAHVKWPQGVSKPNWFSASSNKLVIEANYHHSNVISCIFAGTRPVFHYERLIRNRWISRHTPLCCLSTVTRYSYCFTGTRSSMFRSIHMFPNSAQDMEIPHEIWSFDSQENH